ncbi:Pex2 / Pex12 amino terminal region [Rhizoctonia solani]|uniref:RING-type E3 ubiquitin transferase n=1 Tax=Rhizoctonia solani TaxID=456999 RepID=A0A8H7IIL6_9AGAM|nr:Pex2 / Pex12 amino terminal region [Rhizoctonia solani]
MSNITGDNNQDESILPSFPPATQAQIIRSNQKDLQHITQLREQISDIIRNYLGSRWLYRREAEVELAANVLYSSITCLRATQTLGEEYVGMWAYSFNTKSLPSRKLRAALILLPGLPSYIHSKLSSQMANNSSLYTYLRALPAIVETAAEINLVFFYMTGTYYSLIKRIIGVRHVSTYWILSYSSQHANQTQNTDIQYITRPQRTPSFLFLLRYSHVHPALTQAIHFPRQTTQISGTTTPAQPTNALALSDSQPLLAPQDGDIQQHQYIDTRSISDILVKQSEGSEVTVDPEVDEFTSLHIASIDPGLRVGRRCALCLEERTATTSTECGHLFCWGCIVGWVMRRLNVHYADNH